jgi:hypothetical protein
MSTDYRWLAREALARAKSEIGTGNPDRLPYAALELRKAMEALTYDKAQSYKDEVPADLYRTWQPRKVVDYITEIDEHSFQSSSLSLGIEEEPGKPAKVMKPLGTETSLTMKNLKDHYNALGSFLHIPTPVQLEKAKSQSKTRLQEHCAECVYLVEKILASPVWNANFGNFAETECIRCDFPIKKRLPPGFTGPVDARCINCGAEYIVSDEGERKTGWTAKVDEVGCPTPGCNEKIVIWKDEFRPGRWWTCEGCGQPYILRLSIGKWSPTDSAGS